MGGSKSKQGMADVFNRWWAQGATMPEDWNPFGVYFEVMTAGNVWLPEDLDFIIAEYSGGAPGQQSYVGPPGIWGTALGSELRAFLKAHGRPLIWADTSTGAMLIDPIVGGIAGGRITEQDKDLFQSAAFKKPWEPGSFQRLAAAAPLHLHFHWQR